MAKMNVLVARFAPSLGDRMAEMQFERQQYDEPPRDPQGPLHRRGRTGRTYGAGGERAKAG